MLLDSIGMNSVIDFGKFPFGSPAYVSVPLLSEPFDAVIDAIDELKL